MDQRGLIERARRGEHDAFTALLDVHLARLDAAARLILRDPELARDAVQEALIRAWRDLPGLRDPDRFDAWLHRLTVNACLDLIRRRKRRVIEVELKPIDSPATHDAAGALADRELLDQALDAPCSPAIARSLPCTICSGCRCRRWPRTLGIPVGTAKSRLHYALAAMRTTVTAEHRTRSGHRRGRADRMTSPRRFEQDLPALLADLYLSRTPDYRDDLVQQIARVRQRPAWTFPERWLPMDLATPSVFRPALPWRQLGVLALIGLLIAAALAAYVGSNRPLPAPFGLAANGVVALVDDAGAIQRVDPVSGEAVVIVPGPGNSRPTYSPDGRSSPICEPTAIQNSISSSRTRTVKGRS